MNIAIITNPSFKNAGFFKVCLKGMSQILREEPRSVL